MVATRSSRQAIWAFIEHEHRELVRGTNRIHEVACEVGRRASPELSVHVLDVLRWFDTTLEPHMAWEEAMLYPEIDDRAGTPWATRATRFDHEQIREMAARLRAGQHALGHAAGTEPAIDLRCRLFALEALLRAHLEREERFLIPILSEDRPGTPIDAGSRGGRVPAIPRSRV